MKHRTATYSLQHLTQFAQATCGTIRLKLLKIGALVRTSVRRVAVAMASAFPHQSGFALAHVRGWQRKGGERHDHSPLPNDPELPSRSTDTRAQSAHHGPDKPSSDPESLTASHQTPQ